MASLADAADCFGRVVPLRARTLESALLWRDWRVLAEMDAPFCAPEWVALNRALVDGEPVLAVGHRGAQVAGVLPLVRHGRTLESLRSPHSFVADLSGSVHAVWRALVDDRSWQVLRLVVPAESPLATELPALARADGCAVTVRPGMRSPWFTLAGFESRLSAHFDRNLRRCARKLGDGALERVTRWSRGAFAAGLAIEAAAWKGQAGSSIDGEPRRRHLYATAFRLWAPRSRAALCFLRAHDRRIAFLYTLEDRGHLYALKIGYDPAFADVSPAHLLVREVAADAHRRGLETFEFLGNDEPWKLKWTDRVRQQVAVVVYRPSLRNFVEYAGRELLKGAQCSPTAASAGT